MCVDKVPLNWHISKTGYFDTKGLARLRDSNTREIITRLNRCLDIVSLRTISELIAHGQSTKAKSICRDKNISKKLARLRLRLIQSELYTLLNEVSELEAS